MMHILVINGPNLNLLGQREPDKYGNKTLEQLNNELTKAFIGTITFDFFQSNHEGALVDYLQQTKANGIIINLGAFTHTSIALRDALLAIKAPAIEVHISNIFKREDFRKKSFISEVAIGVISGLGTYGYHLAAQAFLDRSS